MLTTSLSGRWDRWLTDRGIRECSELIGGRKVAYDPNATTFEDDGAY